MKDNVDLRYAGFSLLETLVAIMVLSIVLVIIMQLFSGGLRAGKLTDSYTQALSHAQNRMETVLISEDLKEGVTKGKIDENFTWEVNIRPVMNREEIKQKWNGFNLFDINIAVMWNEAGIRKKVELDTLSLAKNGRRES